MATINQVDAAFAEATRRVPMVARLGGGELARMGNGAPWRLVGQEFATYALRKSDGQVLALQVPLAVAAARPERLAHWEAIGLSPALAPLRGDRGALPTTLQVDRGGVLLTEPNGALLPYPVIAIEYLDKGSLRAAVTTAVTSRDTRAISGMARQVAVLALALEGVGFDHGNLTPETIMVRGNGSLALNDLDGAWWPDAPSEAPRPHRDRPMTMLLFTEMLALAADPRLPNQPPWRGTLALSESDLGHPDQSALLDRWIGSSDPLAAAAAGVVREVFSRRMSVPSFRDFVSLIETQAVPLMRGASHGAGNAAALSDDGLTTPAVDVSAAPPAPIPPTPEEAAAAADRVARAVRRQDVATVEGWWTTARHHPTSGLLAPEVQELLATDVEQALDRAVVAEDPKAARSAVARADALGVALPAATRQAVRRLERQERESQEVHAAIERRDVDAIAELAAAGTIDVAGGLSPREALARDRALAWPKLARALATDDDQLILAAWDPAVLTGDPSITPEREARIKLAQQRVTWLDYVREAMRKSDRDALGDLLAEIPPGIDKRLTEVERKRIERMMQATDAVERFRRAQRSGSDADIVDAAEALERTGTPFPTDTDWQTVLSARERVQLMRTIREESAASRPDWTRIGRLMATARAAGTRGYREDELAQLTAIEEELLRQQTLRMVRAAMAAGDWHAVAAEVHPDVHGVIALLSPAEQAQMAREVRLSAAAGQRRHN